MWVRVKWCAGVEVVTVNGSCRNRCPRFRREISRDQKQLQESKVGTELLAPKMLGTKSKPRAILQLSNISAALWHASHCFFSSENTEYCSDGKLPQQISYFTSLSGFCTHVSSLKIFFIVLPLSMPNLQDCAKTFLASVNPKFNAFPAFLLNRFLRFM